MKTFDDKINKLRSALRECDAVIVGAGAGFSTAAGFTYAGERLMEYFPDFVARYGFTDMYSGGFYPFPNPEEQWAYWSRYIYINRFMNAPKPLYENLLSLIREKDYFIITTNVDHCFQKAGFDKARLFYTQGDYGLWQCSVPCHEETYDNESVVREMVLSQGFTIAEGGGLVAPANTADLSMRVPLGLVPRCPRCGEPMAMNLRADDTFVEDEGWFKAALRYRAFCESHKDANVLFWEMGVGYNTPGIIKYPFWHMTRDNPQATYACVNFGEAACPKEIKDRSICLQADVGEVLKALAS